MSLPSSLYQQTSNNKYRHHHHIDVMQTTDDTTDNMTMPSQRYRLLRTSSFVHLIALFLLSSSLSPVESSVNGLSSSAPSPEKPVINPFLFGSNLREGMRTSVLCSVISGDSPLTITWYKNNELLQNSHPDVEIINLGEFTSTLRISSVRRDHAGNYTCEAKTFKSSASYSADMVVQASPKWMLKPNHEYSVLQGRNLIIDCQTQGYPVPIHQWKKKVSRQQLQPSSQQQGQTHLRLLPPSSSSDDAASMAYKDFAGIVSGPHVHVLENGSLVILDAEKSDEGEYICGSSNTVGSLLSSPVLVRVHAPAHFKKNFESIKARVGDRVQMICEAYGDDVVKITWGKDGEILSNSYSPTKKYVIQDNPGRTSSPSSSEGGSGNGIVRTSRLTMDTVDIPDSAFYVCTASNQYGKDDMNIQLVVQGPPEAPTNLRASEINGRRIVVEWKESHDGNSPLIEYVLNYRKGDGPWNQETESVVVGAKQLSVPVTGLRPNTVYKLRVFARNSLGKSLPSEELLVKTEEEPPSDVPSNVRIETLSSKSLRVHWIFPSTEPHGSPSFQRNYDGFYVGFRDITSSSSPTSTLDIDGRGKNSMSSMASSPSFGRNPAAGVTYTFKTIEVTDKMFQSSKGHGDFHATLSDLKRNARYAIIVQAFNRKGPGPTSEEIVAQTAEFDAPSQMVLRVTPLDHHSLSLSWDTDEETPITGYVISYKSTLDNWEELKMLGKRSSYILDNLRCGTKYQITATAYNKAGRSKASDVVSAATAGNVPSAPSFDALVKSNSTTAVIDLTSWSDNGCPIMYFVVQYKEHFLSDWIMLSNNIIPEQAKVYISDLVSSTWYDLSMIAHSEAGSSEAQYLFSTLTPAGATISPLSVTSDPSWEVALYDPVVVAPVVCTCFVLIVVFGTVGYFTASSRRIQAETSMENYSTIGSRKMESLSMNSLRVKSVSGINGSGRDGANTGCVTSCDDGIDVLSSDGGGGTVLTDGKKLYDVVQRDLVNGYCTYYASPFISAVNRVSMTGGGRGGSSDGYTHNILSALDPSVGQNRHRHQDDEEFGVGDDGNPLTPQSAEATAVYALHKDSSAGVYGASYGTSGR